MGIFINLLLAASMLLSVIEPKQTSDKSIEEVIVVELKIENILEVQRIEVPINKSPLSGGRGKTGGGSSSDRPGSYFYALEAQKLSKRKVKVHFSARIYSEDWIEKEFVVVRGKKSEHKFEHGISIIAYFSRATPNNGMHPTANSAAFIRETCRWRR